MTTKNWYFEINDYCRTLSEVYNLPVIKVAGIMSALSVNTTFRLNITSLENFIKTSGNSKVSTYGSQKQKALKILNSHNEISIDEVKQILGGMKTKAFFDNIVRPHISREVTVDLWMIRWADMQGSLTPKKYRDISNKIIELADDIGLMPHQVQAKLWVDIRGKSF